MTRLLELRDVVAGHDGTPAVRNLSLHVDAGEIVALLGPNGAGKTTTLLSAAGVLDLIDGEIVVLGEPAGSSPHRVARRGAALLPEDRGIFFQLSTSDNLRLHRNGRHCLPESQVLEYFPALGELLERKAGLLSGGEQQMLALACKLTMAPKLLMIDEMSMGLAPIIVERLLPILRQVVADLGAGVLLVEQHVNAALGVADRAYVLNHGELVLEGTGGELRERPDILRSSYLGDGALPD